jgi:hypothetical protein
MLHMNPFAKTAWIGQNATEMESARLSCHPERQRRISWESRFASPLTYEM